MEGIVEVDTFIVGIPPGIRIDAVEDYVACLGLRLNPPQNLC